LQLPHTDGVSSSVLQKTKSQPKISKIKSQQQHQSDIMFHAQPSPTKKNKATGMYPTNQITTTTTMSAKASPYGPSKRLLLRSTAFSRKVNHQRSILENVRRKTEERWKKSSNSSSVSVSNNKKNRVFIVTSALCFPIHLSLSLSLSHRRFRAKKRREKRKEIMKGQQEEQQQPLILRGVFVCHFVWHFSSGGSKLSPCETHKLYISGYDGYDQPLIDRDAAYNISSTFSTIIATLMTSE
jgi:hypothetical protein